MAVVRAVLVLLASTAQAWMPDANARIHIKYGKISIRKYCDIMKVYVYEVIKYIVN